MCTLKKHAVVQKKQQQPKDSQLQTHQRDSEAVCASKCYKNNKWSTKAKTLQEKTKINKSNTFS